MLDIMVPLDRLPETERRLREAGWQSETLDPYDEHYYRDWGSTSSRRCAIKASRSSSTFITTSSSAPLGCSRTHASFSGIYPVETRPFRILCPADQVLHAAVHLFQDSDCATVCATSWTWMASSEHTAGTLAFGTSSANGHASTA